MCESKILELKKEILSGNVENLFFYKLLGILDKNKVLYTDNYGCLPLDDEKAVSWVEPFMHLLYRGSKHSVGNYCENGFVRVIKYEDVFLIFKYYSGTESCASVTRVNEMPKNCVIITLELLQERLQEAEDVKNELAPIIEKYLKAGLTFEEIVNMFVEIMRENRIKLQ